jgi:glyoxylase-like metal-dependent hydrolase (beta-lactamase superfamily II)
METHMQHEMMRHEDVQLVANQGWDKRILVCRCGTIVDAFVVITERYLILIDTLINPETAAAMLAIARRHKPDGQLLVINTHADWDHCWGNQLFTGANTSHSAPIIASRRCTERLRSAAARQELADLREQRPGYFDLVVLTPPTILFDHWLTIEGGDLTLQLFMTPGHQPDHISIFIPEISTLFAGDAAELPFPFVESAASLPDLRASLEKMAKLRATHVFYCHAPERVGPKLLQGNIAYFNKLEQRCKAALNAHSKLSIGDGANLEALIAFPFEDAVPPGFDAEQLACFYRSGHHSAIRAMLEHLSRAATPGVKGSPTDTALRSSP